ncbi:MAG: NAD(P)-dependent oxidoreductase [Selenomonadaceae bacterium]|nr:NAD(P)-dependent oxidoreductase [Selenomonadaceae bacterium]
MKRALISGATSMLGVALIEECLRHSIDVIAIARRNSPRLDRLPRSDRIHLIECDLDELKSFEPSDGGADAFYHFAWGSTGRDADGNDLRLDPERQTLNIGYTLDAVRLAKRFGCRKFLFAGSQAEYGISDRPLDRNTPIKPTMAYGVTKYAAGRLAEMLCRSLALDFVHMRILSVYGINDGANTLISYLVRSYLNNERPQLTAGEQLWDYLHADDAARCFRLLGECNAARGVYNIGSGRARPLRDYVEIIHRLTGSTVPLIFGERPYAPNQVMHLEADIGDLRRDVGFEPTISFEDGIARIVDAIRKTH